MYPVRKVVDFDEFLTLLDIPDFDMLIMIAIGSQNYIHSDINELYQVNKEYYYDLFKKSPYYSDKRIKCLSAQNYRAIQQFIGLHLHENNHNTNDITLKLIKKGYKLIYNYVKRNQKIDFYNLRDTYLKYVRSNGFSKTVHSGHVFGVGLYLCREFDKSIIYDEFDVSLLNSSFTQIFSILYSDTTSTNSVNDFLGRYRDIGMHRKDFTLPLNEFITEMTNIHKKHYAKENGIDFYKHADRLNRIIENHPFTKGLNKTAIIFQKANIHPIDLQNITPITHKVISDLVNICFTVLGDDRSDEDFYSLLGSFLLIYALTSDYNDTKHNYIIRVSDEVFHEIHELKKEYERKVSLLEDKEKENAIQLSKLADHKEKLQKTFNEQEKQLIKKDKEIEILKQKLYDKETELSKVKRQIASKEAKDNATVNISIVEIVERINQMKCVAIGGSKSWQNSLNEHLTSCRFIMPDRLNIELDFIASRDFIIFDEQNNNHSMFQKVKAIADSAKIPIVYTGGISNTKRLLSEIYNQLLAIGTIKES